MRPPVFILSLLHTAATILIRSYVPPKATCNETAGTACFAELYGMMEEVCMEKELRFKCVHYTYLNQCYDEYVGKCSANAVGQYTINGYRQAASTCENRQRHHKTSDGMIQLVGPPTKEMPNQTQLVSSLGYLQIQCSLSKHNNCSSEHVHNIITQCEERMKPTAGYSHFDRHRLLRIKLDTSRKLMTYPETDRERECLVVRSILSELFTLHQKHCHHSIVTRCLCERMHFHQECSIDCDKLEATSPNENQLAWEDWKMARLIRSSARPSPMQIFVLLCIIICSFRV